VWATRYISIGSVLAAVSLAPFAYMMGSPTPIVAAAAGCAILIVFRHRTNLARVNRGTEPHVGARV
jgi:glycerol-3-phosphate acyltransferase PlsY